jgi:hypothetical protein
MGTIFDEFLPKAASAPATINHNISLETIEYVADLAEERTVRLCGRSAGRRWEARDYRCGGPRMARKFILE